MYCADIKETNNVSIIDDFPKSIQDLINNIIKNEGYIKYNIKKKQFSMDGNFLGSLYEVNIVGITENGTKETPLFIKKSVVLEKIALASVTDVFSRELFFYNDLSEVFSSLQEAVKIPVNERFKVAKSYESSLEVIALENLTKRGFKTYHRTQVSKIKFAELSIMELAKFHALSFVVREKLPKYFDEKIKSLKSILNLDSDWRILISNTSICAMTAKVLKGEVKNKISKYAPRFCQLYKKYLQDVVSPNGCVCHGDYKICNILVKEKDGEASEIYAIDFQLIYYGNPVEDFLYFVFSSTDQEFRRRHLSYLKELYFESFAKFLRYFDMDVESTYPRRDFERDYQERFELGLVFGLYLAMFNFAHVDEGFDVTKLSLSELPLIPDEMFAQRVNGIVEDYVEWGYL